LSHCSRIFSNLLDNISWLHIFLQVSSFHSSRILFTTLKTRFSSSNYFQSFRNLLYCFKLLTMPIELRFVVSQSFSSPPDLDSHLLRIFPTVYLLGLGLSFFNFFSCLRPNFSSSHYFQECKKLLHCSIIFPKLCALHSHH
jgi:hypothetical protein